LWPILTKPAPREIPSRRWKSPYAQARMTVRSYPAICTPGLLRPVWRRSRWRR
jgi:hypothetical protein